MSWRLYHLWPMRILLLFLVLWPGCSKEVPVFLLKKEDLGKTKIIKAPAKIFLTDATVALFKEGFEITNDTLYGKGTLFYLDKNDTLTKTRKFSLDSVAAVSYYEEKNGSRSFGRGFAWTYFGIVAGIMTPMSIYCLSCPKCCFGSCPTIYTCNDSTNNLEAELFSSSISSLLEDSDLDVLAQKPEKDGGFGMRITNEALETHYINKFNVSVVNHPKGTRILPDDKRGYILIKNPEPPQTVLNSEGLNISNFVNIPDNLYYRSDKKLVQKFFSTPSFDYLDIKFNAVNGENNIKLVLNLRNTLLSTILFYDVVLASQGIGALEWTDRISREKEYAKKFKEIYKLFSGITVKIKKNDKWVEYTKINDVGPIVWKEIGLEVPVENPGENVIRLQFVPDNFMIDYIAIDKETGLNDNVFEKKLKPLEITNNSEKKPEEIFSLIEKNDDLYLITEPGDEYFINYKVPDSENSNQTIIIRSKGYYTEWLRGDWTRSKSGDYVFDLSKINETFAELAKSWLNNKDIIEKKFFDSRIPVRRSK